MCVEGGGCLTLHQFTLLAKNQAQAYSLSWHSIDLQSRLTFRLQGSAEPRTLSTATGLGPQFPVGLLCSNCIVCRLSLIMLIFCTYLWVHICLCGLVLLPTSNVIKHVFREYPLAICSYFVPANYSVLYCVNTGIVQGSN